MGKITKLNIFNHIETAEFIARPNRFMVECFHKGRAITAYLPNPGRLWELLQKNQLLYITKTAHISDRSTEYTVIAVDKDGVPVFLHTHHTNTVVGWLIGKQGIPGLEDYVIEKPEFTVGRSRFDFLLRKGNEKMLLEVKSCTLFHKNMAMFPDAVTDRGRRHIVDIAGSSYHGGVLFVVHSSSVKHFLPEYHIDPEFSKTLYILRNDIFVKAVSVIWGHDLSVEDKATELDIPWDIYEKEGADCGSYLLILNLDVDKEITIGKLGMIFFKKGFYIYIGSAMKDLTARIERHKRKRKNLFWHIDYLRERATVVHALPIRSSSRLECEIAASVSKISQDQVKGFGSSDCNCNSHLFYMDRNPVESREFVDLLLYYRMERNMDDLSR
ncbi:MAG: DNA/RNA nuclease SfsA [Proteobacteria bacterium]|nr:DNA/RNA nuclease SfsA [Pseudomonadota bacterium]